jgi:hypothetical protein
MKKEKTDTGVKNYIMIQTRKLKAHPLNKKHFGENNSNYDSLQQSLQNNGFLLQYPVLCAKYVNSSPIIICGHRRWKIACELNIEAIPAIIIPDIAPDSADAERIMLEDNLHRPIEGRKFTTLERFLLAQKIDSLYACSKRGGDRRSAAFFVLKKPRVTNTGMIKSQNLQD